MTSSAYQNIIDAMTTADDTIAVWILGDVWGVPPEHAANLTDDENLDYGKALLTAASGDGELTEAERDWILGYVTAAGHGPEVLAQLRTYVGGDDIERLFNRGVQQGAQRVCIYDAIRACGADGGISDGERATVSKMADRLGVPADVVDEFVDIYREEQRLKHRRIALAFPDGFDELVHQ
jgi:uncharacterized membrane protein YebE (DUF533 family)